MFFETRLSYYLGNFSNRVKEKVFTLQSSFSFVLFSLFTGFIFGNLFGTFLDTLRLYFFWNGFVGLFILLLVEALNSLIYKTKFFYGVNKKSFPKKDVFQKNSFQPQYSWRKSRIQKDGQPLNGSSRNSQHAVSFLRFKNIPILGEIIAITGIIATFGCTDFTDCTNFKQKFCKNVSFFLYQNVTPAKRTMNSFKIGLLFGFFVDSFKVGS